MKKLGIEDICKHLPYGLKFKYDEEIVSPQIRTAELSTVEFLMNNGKPLLRPMSDLTKEVNIGGNIFIPLIKILSKYSLLDLSPCIFQINEDKNHAWANAQYRDDKVLDAIIYDGNIFSFMNNNGTFSPYNPQRDIQNWLVENMFDIDNLIGQGLAIDINTLL